MHASVRASVRVRVHLSHVWAAAWRESLRMPLRLCSSTPYPHPPPFRLTTAPFAAADGHEQQQGRRKPGHDVLQI
jgi:hypothetical protein